MIITWLIKALLYTTISIIPSNRMSVARADENGQSGRMHYVPTADNSILSSRDRGVLHPPRPRLDTVSDSLTVYVFLLDECVISQFYTPLLNELYEKYNNKKIGFIGYFPSFTSKPDQIEAFGKKYKLAFPLKQDYYKVLTNKFGVTITPEVAVWDHRSDRLIYRGRIDDSYVRVGKRKLHLQHEDLKNILDDWLTGTVPPDTIATQAIGCFINFNDALSAPRSPYASEEQLEHSQKGED